MRISWGEALKATLADKDDTEFMTKHSGKTLQDGKDNDTTLKTWSDKARLWDTYNKGSSDFKTASADGGLDVRIIVARPFIECVLLAPNNPRLGAAAHRPCLPCVQALDAQRHHGCGGS